MIAIINSLDRKFIIDGLQAMCYDRFDEDAADQLWDEVSDMIIVGATEESCTDYIVKRFTDYMK